MAIIHLSGCFPGFFFSESDYSMFIYFYLSFSFHFFLLFFVLGIEPKTSHMLGRHLFFVFSIHYLHNKGKQAPFSIRMLSKVKRFLEVF